MAAGPAGADPNARLKTRPAEAPSRRRGARLIRNKAGATPLDLASGTAGGGRGGAPRRESTLAILRQFYPEAAKLNTN